MNNHELRAWAESQKKMLADMGYKGGSLDELIGESYAQELAGMTEAEAITHLRSLDGLKLLHAYSVFSVRANYSLRANHPVLAEVCLKFMASSKNSDRMFGAEEIGLWLQGTCDKQVSRALAAMVHNREEADELRLVAYSSLELINNKATVMDSLRCETRQARELDKLLKEVDWKFVDSFA